MMVRKPSKRAVTSKLSVVKAPAKEPKRRVPPFGTRKHRLTHAQARRMRLLYLKKFAGRAGELVPSAYGVNIFKDILAQKGCAGLRFYPGVDAKGAVTLMFCGVDIEGNDILKGIIGDTPWKCPPYCGDINGVFNF